jgi:hypothetical protein
MVRYIYDCNYVKVIPMKSRSASEWVTAYNTIHQELTVKGFKPKLQTLDNEALAALKNFFTVNDIAYQFVPPYCHRHNAAERAIRTFKEHFVAGISSVDPPLPIALVGQTPATSGNNVKSPANLETASKALCRCTIHGLVDYNKTAFASPG